MCSIHDEAAVRSLERDSMVEKARQLFEQMPLTALGAHSTPLAAKVLETASTWLSIYPPAVITHDRKTALACIGDIVAAGTATQLGFDAIYLAPVSKSGGFSGSTYTPSNDGNFDPISMDIDSSIGTIDDYKRLVGIAKDNDCVVIDNIIALHTGQGPDFWLALHGDRRYRNLYMMAEIDEEDWHLLPSVHEGSNRVAQTAIPTALVSRKQANALRKYIPGWIDSCDASPIVKQGSGWSATGEICGNDQKVRRWVYLHFFKPSQPVLNDDHPDCQAVRLINGVIMSNIRERGARGIRMDAVPFSVEARTDDLETDNVYTPSAIRKANQRASLIRELGGFSFQELNAPIKEVKKFTEYGADIAYDFFTRTPYLHALLTGEPELLKLYFRLLSDARIQPNVLVHDLQNHDEFTYQLPELEWGRELFDYQGKRRRSREIRKMVLNEMRARIEGKSWAKLYREEKDGIATTMVGFLAICLDCDPYEATEEDKERIKKLHLLAVRLNAMQPGVFCVSMWDLVGALPFKVDEEKIKERLVDADYRWMNRGGVDLMEMCDSSEESCWKLPRTKALYGALSDQLSETTSFASQVQRMLNARRKYRIASGELISPLPDTDNTSVCVLPVRLNLGKQFALTFLNFGRKEVDEEIDLEEVLKVDKARVRGQDVIDISTDKSIDTVKGMGRVVVTIPEMGGKTLLIQGKPTSPA